MAITIKWLSNQSWFKLTINNIIIHIDPVYYKTYEGVDKELTEKADIILITHSHYDHCEPETICKLIKPETIMAGPEACKEKIKSGLRVIKAGDTFDAGNISIRAVYAYNIGKHYHPKGFGVGYVITADAKNIYHAGDTDNIPEMKELKNIDMALLPIGGTYTMDLMEAVEAAGIIKPKIVIPMHKLEANLEKFKTELEMKNLKALILKPGEEFTI